MIFMKRHLILFRNPDSMTELPETLGEHNWQVHSVSEVHQARELVKKHIILTGLCLFGSNDDPEYLQQIQTLFTSTPCIHWIAGLPKSDTPSTHNASAVNKLIADYCHDYVVLPVTTDRLLFALGHAYGMAELCRSPFRQLDDFPNQFDIIGHSPVMRNLFNVLAKVSQEDYSVLIEGETGTGKELIANAIHHHSARKKHPLVAINCGTFPKDLIQAELFGYEKGAFTGAVRRTIGRIESAQGGTLFLDEIGDLPLEQQVNLLRFLEEKSINRLGGQEKISIDVRIIAATHVDLKAAIREGRFREDLYYRLKVLQIAMPPLSSRDNDIELLAQYFFDKFTESQRYKPRGFSPDALRIMRNYDWPGNVRELMNCVRQAVVMSENRLLTPADLGLERRLKDRAILTTLEEARAYADRESIINSLRHTNNNMSRAAELLGISRISLYRLIEKYKLEI